jgi:hypothetical protein
MVNVCPPGMYCFDTSSLFLTFGISIIIMVIIISNKKKELLNDVTSSNNKVDQIYNLYDKLDDQQIKLNKLESKIQNKNNKDQLLEEKQRKIDKLELKHYEKEKEIKQLKERKPKTIIINSPPPQNSLNLHPDRIETPAIRKFYDRINDPLTRPERSIPYAGDYLSTTSNRRGIPINIPTRGYEPTFQQVGTINKGDKILPLYGRPTYPGSDKYQYYTETDQYRALKLQIFNKTRECNNDLGCNELYDKDDVTVPQYGNDQFKVTLYDFDKPRYIPFV